MIYGDNRPFNVALVVANLPAVTKWAEDERISLPTDPSAVLTDSRVRTLFEREIKRCGATFKGYEAVADFALIPTDFTVDNDMLTPKMSLKRRRVLEVYGSLIDSLYAKRRDRFAATVSQN
jgi:long-chain acyl-CoA synthetase